jgi:hypothetical protein
MTVTGGVVLQRPEQTETYQRCHQADDRPYSLPVRFAELTQAG